MPNADPEMPKRPGKQTQRMGVTTFRLRPDQLEWLIAKATEKHMTATELVRQLIDDAREMSIKH